MSGLSVSDGDTGLPGPTDAFAIAPDDHTRKCLVAWHREYGDIYCVPDERGGAPQWLIHDPALVGEVLVRRSQDFTKGKGLDRVKILLGNGIMVSEGAFWARQRRLLQPAFKPRILADFTAMICAENEALAERWAAEAGNGSPVEVAAAISELTLVIVLKSIFGADYATLLASGDNPFSLLTTEPERDLKFAARFHQLKKVVDRIVDDRQARPREDFDFLGHMLAARSRDGEAMARRELIDEVMTLIVAGHETTASALAWAWHLIATHPRIRARLQQEADTVDGAALRADDGPAALPYTQQVIDETLRLYPPGWLLSRRAIGDGHLGDYPIGEGTQVFISPYILHRHERYWRAPERFDPARFGAGAATERFAYVPFAAGRRRCIGEQMALTEMRVHLATLLRRLTPVFAGDAPPRLESQINLRPRDGILIHWNLR